MQLRALSVNSRHFVSFTQNLEHGLQNLSQILDQVHQDSEVRFAEAGLEVEAVRVAALNSINEVAANLSMQANQLRELELYMDSFYQHLQSNEPTTAEETCRCKEISKSLVRLEQEIANVTDLARENRYALEDEEAKKGQGDWPVELEDLNQGLLSVKESLAFEQAKSRALNDNVSQLKALLLGSQKEIFEFKECVVAKSAEIRHLSESFSSLLKDATRHADVLEVLIGDEVMEFLSWSSSQQQELSIPILLQKMQLLQEKIESHESRLASVRRKREERDHMNTDVLGAFSEQSLIKEQGTAAADERDSLAEAFVRQLDRDYSASNIWSLGRKMEELAERLSQLEEQHHNCTAAPSGDMVELQGEVVSLRQALEDHLRTFQNLFTYTEELSSSPHSLKLDQLWTEINRKDRKRKDKMEARSNLRKEPKRTASKGPSYSSVAFIAGLDDRTSRRGTLLFQKVTLNHGNAYSPSSGAFDAPQTGVYLFLVTLDFEKGPCLVRLMRDAVPAATFRQEQRQGELRSRAFLLELRKGERVMLELLKGTVGQRQPNENTLSGILLFSTEDTDYKQDWIRD
uniref:Multimerin 2b n=2 Tax=Electrophorus electricus TaxID=8005 RepID=A0A4W4GE28_ELEEL